MQKQDAQERTIVWDADKIGRLDSSGANAEFEGDPDLSQGASHGSVRGDDEWLPVGTRSKGGAIVPFSKQPPGLESVEGIIDTDASAATQELLFTGRAECVPDSVQCLVS